MNETLAGLLYRPPLRAGKHHARRLNRTLATTTQ